MLATELSKSLVLSRGARILLTDSTIRKYSTTSSFRQQQDQQQSDADQLKVFRDNATRWWSGKEFSILRSMNEIRVPFVVNGIGKPMSDCKILDVGCGGGILSEPLARLGAQVLGIDPVFESINQAQIHAQTDEELTNRLKYRNCNIEDISSQKEHQETYDALVASEVLEHIVDVESFLVHCNKVIKPQGSLFITTINQTPLSWLGVIFFGEYVLQQLPKGTHTYDMFVNVRGLRIMLERMGYHIRLVNGFMYEPIGGKFYWTPTTLSHYAIQAVKRSPSSSSSSSSMKKGGDINYQQKRYLAAKSSSASKKLQKPKIVLDNEDMMSVIPYNTYEEKANLIIAELKSFLENDLTTRANTGTLERLKINIEGLNEPLELRDIAQISMKGSNLMVINLSTMPEAVKSTMKAIEELGNMNPQAEVNNIYVPIPRVTREHRENLVSVAKQTATKSKDKLRALFSEFSSRAKRPGLKVSSDLVHETVENLQFDINKRLFLIDELIAKKASQLLNN